MWQAGTFAAVHATGMPTPNRSHFAAMEAIEDAAPGSTARNGWLNRLLGELPGGSPLQGTALGNQVPTSLFGTNPAFVVGRSTTPRSRAPRRTGAAWPRSSTPGRARADEPRGPRRHRRRGDLRRRPRHGRRRTRPGLPGQLARQGLSGVSRIIRSGVGAEVITVDQGDWDMHTDLGTLEWGT